MGRRGGFVVVEVFILRLDRLLSSLFESFWLASRGAVKRERERTQTKLINLATSSDPAAVA